MGEHKQKEALLAQAAVEMARFERPIVLEMDIANALVFCGALQLALRHPGFAARASSREVRRMVMELKDQVPAEFPAIKRLMELGSHPRFDDAIPREPRRVECPVCGAAHERGAVNGVDVFRCLKCGGTFQAEPGA